MLKIWEEEASKSEYSLRIIRTNDGLQLSVVDSRGRAEMALATLLVDGTLRIEPSCDLFPELIGELGFKLDEDGCIETV